MEISEQKQFRIANGYDALIAWLRAGVSDPHALRLGAPVSEVRWKRGEVEVITT